MSVINVCVNLIKNLHRPNPKPFIRTTGVLTVVISIIQHCSLQHLERLQQIIKRHFGNAKDKSGNISARWNVIWTSRQKSTKIHDDEKITSSTDNSSVSATSLEIAGNLFLGSKTKRGKKVSNFRLLLSRKYRKIMSLILRHFS